MSKPKKIMIHTVYGYPDSKVSKKLILGLDKIGVNYIEVQIPFSDPIADGPILAEANNKASLHTSTDGTLAAMRYIVPRLTKSEVVIVCYFHTIFTYGVDNFCKRLAATGIKRLIVPDLPYDQRDYAPLKEAARSCGIVLVPVVSPQTSQARLCHYVDNQASMVYLTARSGVTGGHTDSPQFNTLYDILSTIKLLNPKTEILLGFGIQAEKDIAVVPEEVDTVVVGSAVTQSLDQNGQDLTIALVQGLLNACNGSKIYPISYNKGKI